MRNADRDCRAYRLADGLFAKEAMDELVDSVTKDKYAKKLIIILAGYEKDINRLMNMNSGLTSRFPEVIDFRGLRPHECIELLTHELKMQQARLANPNAKKQVALDVSILESLDGALRGSLTRLFDDLSRQDNWASARDVKTVAKSIFNRTIKDRDGINKGRLTVERDVVERELSQMLQERAGRIANTAPTLSSALNLGGTEAPLPPGPGAPKVTTSTMTTQATKMKTLATPPTEDEEPRNRPRTRSQTKKQRDGESTRDAGVSDEIWEQLQRDRQVEQEREQQYLDLLKAQRDAREADREKIMKKLLEEEERRKEEEEARKKLEMMGKCPVGYHWIRQANGYRCAGGSHFMSDAQVSVL